MKKPIFKWGIIGSGLVAGTFCESMKFVKDAKIVANSSKNKQRAKDFQDEYELPNSYGSYTEMLEKEEIDAVYIATTNNYHLECIKLALNYGKHVLCEKPIVLNEKEFIEVSSLAKEKKVLLMEGMWSLFLPAIMEIKAGLDAEIIGEVKYVSTVFQKNFHTQEPEDIARILMPELGGGGLLDLGVYNLAFIDMVFEKDFQKINSIVHKAYTGVDDSIYATIEFGENKVASLVTSISIASPREVTIIGNLGHFKIPNFHRADLFHLILEGDEANYIAMEYKEPGFQYEIASFMETARKGELENRIMPHARSQRILKIMDAIRKEGEIEFPSEKK